MCSGPAKATTRQDSKLTKPNEANFKLTIYNIIWLANDIINIQMALGINKFPHHCNKQLKLNVIHVEFLETSIVKELRRHLGSNTEEVSSGELGSFKFSFESAIVMWLFPITASFPTND